MGSEMCIRDRFIIIPLAFSSSTYLSFPPPGFSLRWFQSFFSDDSWVSALSMSLIVGIMATVLALLFGISAAIGLSKWNFKGKDFIEQIFLLPMMIPSIIIAVGLFRFESQLAISGSVIGLIIAHTVIALPYVIAAVYTQMSEINNEYENAALSLGAGPLQAFFRVTLPLIKSSIISGGLFAFSISFDEVVITQFIAGVDTTTLPIKIWEGVRSALDPTITAISAIIIVGVTAMMFILNFRALFPKRNALNKKEN